MNEGLSPPLMLMVVVVVVDVLVIVFPIWGPVWH